MAFSRLAILASFVLLLGACANPSEKPSVRDTPASLPERARLDGTTHHRLTSKYVDQTFSIDVWQPIGVPGPLPVVYVMDGNSMFATAYQIVMPMIFAQDFPPVVVVGVGYEVEAPTDVVALRTRDLLPTPEANFEAQMAQIGLPVPANFQTGRADSFLEFIEKELKPFIASHYPVDSKDETLVGLSYGGTFAFHALINSPGTFERYVIGSPVLDRDGGELVQDEERFARSSNTLNARVFLSASEYEVQNGIRPATEAMMKTLRSRGYSGLELKTHIFPEETHQSGLAPTTSRGLRAVFGTWPRKAK